MRSLDNIEEGFANRFDPQNIGSEGWNEPSDVVWDRIDESLDVSHEGKSRYGFYILLSCFIFSLFGVGLLVHQNNSLRQNLDIVNEKLDASHDQLALLSVGSSSSSSSSSSSKESDIQKVESPSNGNEEYASNQKLSTDNLVINDGEKATTIDLETIQSKTNSLKESDEQSLATAPRASANEGSEKIALSDNQEPTTNINIEHSETDRNTSSKEQSAIQIAKISSIPTGLEGNKVEQLDLHYLPMIDPLKNRNSKKSYFMVGIESSSVYLSKQGFQESALSELIDNEYGDSYISISSEYGRALSTHWSISGGLELNRQSFITEYDITLPYNVGQEVIENGSGYIDFEHSLPTSFGNTDTELRLLRRNASEPLAQEDVNIDFNTKHTFIALRAPIQINYHLSSPSEGLFIGVEAVPFYILDARSGIESVVSQHSQVMSVNNASTSDYNTLTRANIGLGINMGYRFPVFHNGGIELDLGYRKNLRSHFATNNFSSQLSGVNFKAGYYLNF